jgi:hypothetical protein
MEHDELNTRLEELESPAVRALVMRAAVKRSILAPHTSAVAGVTLVAIPCLFVLAIVLHYGAGVAIPGLARVEDVMSQLDQRLPWISPLILAGAPLLALGLNVLAIVHVARDRARREFQVTVRVRWSNIAIIMASGLVLLIVFAHLLAERARHLQ